MQKKQTGTRSKEIPTVTYRNRKHTIIYVIFVLFISIGIFGIAIFEPVVISIAAIFISLLTLYN